MDDNLKSKAVKDGTNLNSIWINEPTSHPSHQHKQKPFKHLVHLGEHTDQRKVKQCRKHFLKCYHESKIFNMALIHRNGAKFDFTQSENAYQVWNTSGLRIARARGKCLSRANNLSSDVFFHVTSIVCFQLIKSDIQKRQFSQIWFIHRLLNLPLKIFHPKKSFPTRLGNKTKRNLLNILSITHALLSESKIFFEEKFVYTTIARRTAAGSLKTQWWRRLSANQGKEKIRK